VDEWIAGKKQDVPMVVGKETTWTIDRIESNIPMVAEMFELRFPEYVGILENGKPAKARKSVVPLRVGAEAPDWAVTGWTDGKQRKLIDYRGKVVVLDFWGTWCGPCCHEIPLMNRLQAKFKNQGVLFFAIHSAGPDPTELKESVQRLKFDVVCGVDVGPYTELGESVDRFGVRGFPTVIVVDHQGKVTFNSGVGDRSANEKELKRIAGELGIPWPIDADVVTAETTARMDRILERLYNDAIKQALQP
jgi:thiol-disulfide isomerase/thioredoxin